MLPGESRFLAQCSCLIRESCASVCTDPPVLTEEFKREGAQACGRTGARIYICTGRHTQTGTRGNKGVLDFCPRVSGAVAFIALHVAAERYIGRGIWSSIVLLDLLAPRTGVASRSSDLQEAWDAMRDMGSIMASVRHC